MTKIDDPFRVLGINRSYFETLDTATKINYVKGTFERQQSKSFTHLDQPAHLTSRDLEIYDGDLNRRVWWIAHDEAHERWQAYERIINELLPGMEDGINRPLRATAKSRQALYSEANNPQSNTCATVSLGNQTVTIDPNTKEGYKRLANTRFIRRLSKDPENIVKLIGAVRLDPKQPFGFRSLVFILHQNSVNTPQQMYAAALRINPNTEIGFVIFSAIMNKKAFKESPQAINTILKGIQLYKDERGDSNYYGEECYGDRIVDLMIENVLTPEHRSSIMILDHMLDRESFNDLVHFERMIRKRLFPQDKNGYYFDNFSDLRNSSVALHSSRWFDDAPHHILR